MIVSGLNCWRCSIGLIDNRYPPHGRKSAKEEDGVQWNRVRAPPVSTPAHDLHASDCLEELRPGDHFEIQWRKNKDFPYGILPIAQLRSSTDCHVSVGLVHVRWCLCDALQQAGGMASWVTRSRAMGTSICVAATKTVKILSPGPLSFHLWILSAITRADRIKH